MDIQVQELINKIKKDGIESASEEAARIKLDAETEAKRIIEAAQKSAAEVSAQGKLDAERFEKAGIAALQQASRNLILVFKEEVQALLDALVANQLDQSYNEDALKTIIPELVKSWSANPSAGGMDSLAVLLPEASLTKLQSFFKTKLAAELKQGVELKSDRNLASGFRIANKDGSAYYDFSAESVAETLCAYLNPRLAEILKASTKEE